MKRRRSRALHGRVTRWAPVIRLVTPGTLVGGGAAASALVAPPGNATGNGPSATATAVTLLPNFVMVGQQTRITATVTPIIGMPTGRVDFDLDDTHRRLPARPVVGPGGGMCGRGIDAGRAHHRRPVHR
jgi:hypothetical protein